MSSYPRLRRIRLKLSNLREHIQTMYTDQSAKGRRDSWDSRKEECVWTNNSSECPIEGCTQSWEGFGTLGHWYITFLIIREVVTRHIAEAHPEFAETIDMVFVFDGQYHWCLNLCIGDWDRCPREDCNWTRQDGRSVAAHRMLAHPNDGPVGTLLPPYLVDPTARVLGMGEGGIGYLVFRPAEFPTAPELARLEGLAETCPMLSSGDTWPIPASIPRQCTPHPRSWYQRPPSNATTEEEAVVEPEAHNLSMRKHIQNLVRHFDYAYNAVTGKYAEGSNARVTY